MEGIGATNPKYQPLRVLWRLWKIGRVTSWLQLISEFLVAMPVSNVASDWPRTFLHPRCFCLASLLTKALSCFDAHTYKAFAIINTKDHNIKYHVAQTVVLLRIH